MVKIKIFDWAYGCGDLLKQCGFKHKDELEVDDIWWFIEKFASVGMSTLVEYNAEECYYNLFVDLKRKRFRQR